jgi:hypothetical protein
MSSTHRLVKNGMDGGLVSEEQPLIELIVRRTGVQLKSPLQPNEVCKMLQAIATDLMFNSFVRVEPPLVQPVESSIVKP